MAEKYTAQYYDTENVTHAISIDVPDFVGSATEIRAKVNLDYASADDVHECIRGKGLRLDIEADIDNKFEDLSDINDREVKVTYTRGGVTQFVGWITPGGWFEDFVADKWVISLDCMDGLGLLEELSFVDDSTGLPFLGRKTMLDTLALALKRTKLDRNINIDIGIFYDGLANTENVLANAKVNMERYVEDDRATGMSCDKVIRDLLEPFTACITSKGDEWYIWRPLRIAENSERDFFRYDSDGVALSPATVTLDTAQNLGSYANGFYPHHAGGNQRIFAKSALGGYRINYKYGQLQSLLTNPYMTYDSGSGTIPGWTDSGSIYISFPLSGGSGISLTLRDYSDPQVVEIYSDNIGLASGIELSYRLDGRGDRFPAPGYDWTISYRIKLVDGGDTYYLRGDGDWDLNVVRTLSYTNNINTAFTLEGTTAPTPVAGDVVLEILTARGTLTLPGGGTGGGGINVFEFSLSNESEGATDGVEGEFHTFTREDAKVTRVEDVKEVYTGDNQEDNYVGAIYKADDTNTSIWNRDGLTDEISILGIWGTEVMRASQKTARRFTGSVYGFFEYISIITIDGLTGLWIPISYSYDTEENITDVELMEIFTDELADMIYEIDVDYGKVVKPTIKG